MIAGSFSIDLQREMNTKANGRDNVGVCRAHPFSWLLSSPQQPLETEDPPTVSLAPQYTSQRLCRARMIAFAFRNPRKVINSRISGANSQKSSCKLFALRACKTCT